MAITIREPNTIHLAGGYELINTHAAIETLTPGMILELHNDSGVPKWGVHDSADDNVAAFIALEQDELNKTISDTYAAGDLVKVAHMKPGCVFLGIIPSGQNLAIGDLLQSNGDGKLKAIGSGKAKFMALEASGAVTADTRLRVEVL